MREGDVGPRLGTHPAGAAPFIWRAVIAAFCASLIGVGLARFSYSPLIPAIADAHWFSASAAVYLGAGNLAGYLFGALFGRRLSARLSVIAVLRSMMVLATASFFASSFPSDIWWFFLWRFAAGVAGGALMVLAAPLILSHIPTARRGLTGGVIFMGIGAGVIASGTLVPLLLKQGLGETWIGLGILSLGLTLVAWNGWPDEDTQLLTHRHKSEPRSGTLRALYIEYALNAAGWVPHMIFLVDFIARGLGQGIHAGASYWVLFGVGATIGPVLAGHLADRAGFGAALRLAFLLEAVAVGLPLVGSGQPVLIVSSLVVGAFVTGTVPLMLGRIHELLPHHPAQQKVAWSHATVGFALFQAVSAYGFSYIFTASGSNYHILFGIGAVAMLAALAIDLAARVIYAHELGQNGESTRSAGR